MQNPLQKAIRLAKITGDKIIVIDSAKPEDAFVVMELEEYEEFVLGQSEIRSLTEEELLDKINRDVAIWKSENEEGLEKDLSPEREKEKESKAELAEENLYYYQEPEPAFTPSDLEEEKNDDKEKDFDDEGYGFSKSEENKTKNYWQIPSKVKKSAEEVVEDLPF